MYSHYKHSLKQCAFLCNMYAKCTFNKKCEYQGKFPETPVMYRKTIYEFVEFCRITGSILDIREHADQEKTEEKLDKVGARLETLPRLYFAKIE